MRLTLYAFGLAAALATSGCASTTPEVKRILADLPPSPATPTPCDSAECALWWQRAQVWISRHSAMKVQTATDVMIETYNPVDKPWYGFTVTREPVGVGRYLLRIETTCGTSRGCAPPWQDVGNAFSHYIRTGEDVLDGKDLTESSLR